MIWITSDNVIHLTRGDTGAIDLALKLKSSDTEYIVGDGDDCVLTIKTSVNNAEKIFQKHLERTKKKIVYQQLVIVNIKRKEKL